MRITIITTYFALLLAASALAQQFPAATAAPTFAELQREAAALEERQDPVATMAPVRLADVEQIGQEVDRLHGAMANGFGALDRRLDEASSLDLARSTIADVREQSTLYTDVAIRYHEGHLAELRKQIERDRRGMDMADRGVARVETEFERLGDEVLMFEEMLRTLNSEAERLAADPKPDTFRLRLLGSKADMLQQRIEDVRLTGRRLAEEGRELAAARLDVAHEAADLTQRAVYAAENALSEVRLSAMTRGMFLDYLVDRERLRFAAQAADRAPGRGARRGFWPRPLQSLPGAEGVTSPRQIREEINRTRFTECRDSGATALECARRLSARENSR